MTALAEREALVQAVTTIVETESGLLRAVLERLEAAEAKHRRYVNIGSAQAKSDAETIASQRATIRDQWDLIAGLQERLGEQRSKVPA